MPLVQAVTEAREEEDRVVGDNPKHQDDDDRLDLARDRETGALAEPTEDTRRDGVDDTDRQQVHDRRDQRTKVQPHRERDEPGRSNRYGREIIEHETSANDGRRFAARHPDECLCVLGAAYWLAKSWARFFASKRLTSGRKYM